jgi:[protein-PII] uridylyltransferase
VAVGGYGRGELSLQSDIDVLLLHAGRSDIGELADRHWYPIWDARLKLGHAVRTVKEALALAATTWTPPPACSRPATWPATGR